MAARYGESAPAAILAVLFKYTLFLYTLMFMPFMTGFNGLSKAMKSAWLKALITPILLAILYQLMFQENILRVWYQGEFDREYIFGLLKGFSIIPALCFFLGLALRQD